MEQLISELINKIQPANKFLPFYILTDDNIPLEVPNVMLSETNQSTEKS